ASNAAKVVVSYFRFNRTRMMKAFALFLFSCLLLSCRSLSYFESPNHVRNMNGVLYLQNGRSITGKLVVQTDNLFGTPVKVLTEGDEKPMQFRLDAIRGYSINNQWYELKEIRDGLPIGRQRLFMRRLTSPDSRIQLYEHMRKEIVNKTSTRYHAEHYLQLPGEQENLVYAASGSRFVPNFEEKMSQLLGDCPELAKKIAARNDGYFYAQVSLLKEKRVQVLLQIISEYNQCGATAEEL
ncbi:MAG TPA: hypothetical protein VFL47_06015, partial [Flavisolibacter sp.]|nr:hypothetical protein [Flavisolibacter sp.]